MGRYVGMMPVVGDSRCVAITAWKGTVEPFMDGCGSVAFVHLHGRICGSLDILGEDTTTCH